MSKIDTMVTCLDIKTVREVYGCESAQSYIDDGWYLLSVGFDSDGDGSHPVYILGNTEKIARKPSRLEKIIKDLE